MAICNGHDVVLCLWCGAIAQHRCLAWIGSSPDHSEHYACQAPACDRHCAKVGALRICAFHCSHTVGVAKVTTFEEAATFRRNVQSAAARARFADFS